jgi:carbohydrate kinase (thermoresistant glucokinase family)
MTVSIIIFMGVSGSGKTTIGRTVASRIDWPYTEGDEFHPPANVAKMRDSIPLDDADRAPWLAAIAAWMDERLAAGEHAVITCSALKRKYRDLLRGDRKGIRFVYLQVARAELERRVESRHHQYMPASLLGSQLAALEEPGPDEPAVLTVDADGTIEAVVDAVVKRLVDEGIVSANTPAILRENDD